VNKAIGLAGTSALLALSTGSVFATSAHAQVQTVDNTPEPATIRVAIRSMNPSGEPDPRGKIMYVQNIPFREYVEDCLPNEWIPSWNVEALKAGALAVKMFAWYHHLNPITMDGFTYDVDNTTNFQTFRYDSRQIETNAAVNAVFKYAYVRRNGEIIELNYRAGTQNSPNWQYRNAQKMAQWGSQYWADEGRNYLQILQFYYANRDLRQIRT